jgi:heme A synthase
VSHQDILVMILLAAAAITNVVLSLVAVWRAKGLWKLVATLPILCAFIVGLNIVLGISRDPTSHNLWPLEVILWSGVGIIFSIAFIVFQKVFSPTKQQL